MPYNFGGGVKAGVGLASAGLAFGGPVGAAVGGVLGLLSGFAGGDPYAEREKRKRDALTALTNAKAKALREGTDRIIQQTSNIISKAKGDALRGAISSGRASAAEANQLPVVSQAAAAGTNAIGNFQTSTESAYAQQAANIEAEYAMDTPIPPAVSDYLAAIGEASVGVKNMVAKYNVEKELADAEAGMTDVLNNGIGSVNIGQDTPRTVEPPNFSSPHMRPGALVMPPRAPEDIMSMWRASRYGITPNKYR